MVALSTTTDITAPAAPGSSTSWWAENPAKVAAAAKAAAKAERLRGRRLVAPADPPASVTRERAQRAARALLGLPEPTPDPAAARLPRPRRAGALGSVAKRVSIPGQRPEIESAPDETAARRDGEWTLRDRSRSAMPDKRLKRCGIHPVAGGVGIHGAGVEGTQGHLSGVETCSSVWACAVCAPKIRMKRASNLESSALGWVGAGHSLMLITLTIRHKPGDRLKPQMKDVAEAWQQVLGGRWVKGFYDRYDAAGFARAIETTHGKNSWHTHIHALLWLRAPAGDEKTMREIADRIQAELYKRWHAKVTKRGLGAPNQKHGVRVDPMRGGEKGAADLAKYLAKWSLGKELTRADRKAGRGAGRTPFQILRDLVEEKDREKRAADLELWQEYVLASKGRKFLTWAGSIVEELAEIAAVDESSNEELAADAEEQAAVAVVTNEAWKTYVRPVPGRGLALVKAAETGGRGDVYALCVSWGMTVDVDVCDPLTAAMKYGWTPGQGTTMPAAKQKPKAEKPRVQRAPAPAGPCCTECGGPLAAILADTGRHIGC